MYIWYKEKKINKWKYTLLLDDRVKFIGIMIIIGLLLYITKYTRENILTEDYNNFYKIVSIFIYFALDWYFTFNKNEESITSNIIDNEK